MEDLIKIHTVMLSYRNIGVEKKNLYQNEKA